MNEQTFIEVKIKVVSNITDEQLLSSDSDYLYLVVEE